MLKSLRAPRTLCKLYNQTVHLLHRDVQNTQDSYLNLLLRLNIYRYQSIIAILFKCNDLLLINLSKL